MFWYDADEEALASEAELADLGDRVKQLSNETADIVASITGKRLLFLLFYHFKWPSFF